MKNKINKTSNTNVIEQLDESIFEKHITSYIHEIGKMLTYVFIFLAICDFGITVLVYFGYLPFHLKSMKGGMGTYREFLISQILIQVLIFIPFIIFHALYNKSNFQRKKTLLCMLTFTSTFFLCFGHWKNPYISFLFSIPVVITSPLDSKRNVITLILCEASVILYAFYHNLFDDPEKNYLVLAVSTTTVVTFYLISCKIHNSLNKIFIEMKGYQDTQDRLYDELSHDVLTGAFSKSALQYDMAQIENFKSLAFCDIDDFKNVNDKMGHNTGDNFLKLLVMGLKSKDHNVYRYGGDEFVILSKNQDAKELKIDMENTATRFFLASQELYGFHATISVGVININKNESADDNIQRGDSMMYEAKNNGKNRVVMAQ